MLPWTPLDPLKEKAPASGETGASSVLGVVPGMEHVIGDNHAGHIPRPTNNLQLDFLNAMIRKTYDGVDFGLDPSRLPF